MLYVKQTQGTVADVVERIQQASAANGFGVLGVHNLKEKMAAKGVQFDCECMVVEVCNPNQAKNVLTSNMAISTALPCRVSVFEDEGAVKVATIEPVELLKMFDAPDLEPVARQVQETIFRIIDEACK